jgi:hypothetical protein
VNPFLPAVNQKLYFSGLLLQQVDRNHCPFFGPAANLQLALCQSALFQLETAYRLYLREVATTYRDSAAETISSVEGLIAAMESMGNSPSEAAELANLEADKDSWLANMLKAHEHLLEVRPQEVVNAASPIAVVQIEQGEGRHELSADLLDGWLEAFRDLIERHREQMVEC